MMRVWSCLRDLLKINDILYMERKEERDMEVLEEILIHKIWIRHIKTVANKDVVGIDDIAVEEI